MKLYFMKIDALNFFKDNLDLFYTKYYTEDNNKWLWKVYGDNPFIEFNDISKFDLANLESGYTTGEIELENCKILYNNLSFLNESQACDERLWAGLCNSVFYDYVRKRWNYHNTKPKSQKEAVSGIKSRFFFSGGIRAGLYRNTLSKCWWVGRNTYNPSNPNHFEKLDTLGSKDISSKISDIFYSYNFSSNPVILEGIIEGLGYFKEINIPLTVKEHIRPSLQLLNAVGGGVILDCLSKEEIADIIIDNIYSIIQGDEQGVESTEETEENEENFIENETENLTVSLGSKVYVKILETEESKLISADYLTGTSNLPPLVEKMIGKSIGEVISFQRKSYAIEKIEL